MRQITVVPNGIYEPRTAEFECAAQTRADLGCLTAPLIVCAARLEPEKDIGTLIAAMAQVVAERPDARCLVAGTGSQQEFLHKTIERLHLADKVCLLGYREDALALIYASDVFVLPSLTEGFGLVLLEAMALGKPVVATAAGGPLEIVVPDGTGTLVPPSNPHALARALLALLNDTEAQRKMGSKRLSALSTIFHGPPNGAGNGLQCITKSLPNLSKLTMRVLLVSHTCQSRVEGQPRASRLARFPDVELRVLTPDRWRRYGAWRPADVVGADFTLQAGRVAFPWAGPAQGYLHWYPRLAQMLREFRPDIIDLWRSPGVW